MIEFTMMQRFGIETVLSQPSGTVPELMTAFDIINKIKVKDRARFFKSLPNGDSLVDQSAIDNEPALLVDLDKSEARKLQEIFKEYKGFRSGDLEWVLPLKKQVDAQLDQSK